MSDEIKTEVAETVENTAEVKEMNISAEDFIAQRSGISEASTEEVAEDKVEEKTETEPEATETKDDVLSQVDLDTMSEDELREMSEKLGSRAVARFGELTAKRKAAEERVKELEAQASQRKTTQYSESEMEANPYKDIVKHQELQAKAKELNEVIEWAEELIFNSDGLMADDVVTEVEGKELTKKDVRAALMNARKSRTKYLPMQVQKLRNEAEGIKIRKGFEERARQELSWMSEDDNEVNKKYKAMLGDKRLANSLTKSAPEVKAQLPYLLAHAANSLYGRKAVPQQVAKVGNAELDPPKSNSSSAARSERRTNPNKKKATDARSGFKQTGSTSDFIKMRTLQLNKNS